MGKQWKQLQTLFSWAPKSLQMVTTAMKVKDTCPLKVKSMTNLDSILKSRDIGFRAHLKFWMISSQDPYPWWLSGKETTCQCRRQRFDSWIRKIPWRRKWQPTPAFLPGKSHGQRNLVGYSQRGSEELDMT